MKKSGGKNKTKKYRYKKKAGDITLTPNRISIQIPSYPSNASISQSNKSKSRRSLTKTNSNHSNTMSSKYTLSKNRTQFEKDREKYDDRFGTISHSANPYSNRSNTMSSKYTLSKTRKQFEKDREKYNSKFQPNATSRKLQSNKENIGLQKSNIIIPPENLSLMDKDIKTRGDGVKESFFSNVFNQIRKINPFHKDKEKVINLSTKI